MAGPYSSAGYLSLVVLAPGQSAQALYMVVMLRSYLYVLNYLAGPPTIACSMLHSASYYFTLNFGLSSSV